MLQLFHKYQRAWTWLILLMAVVLAFTGFGIDLFSPSRTVDAITINNEPQNWLTKVTSAPERQVTVDQFYHQLRTIEERYRSILGAQYDTFMARQNTSLAQQLVDQTVATTMLDRAAARLDLKPGSTELQKIVNEEVLAGGGGEEAFRAVLLQSGTTREQYVENLGKTLTRRQLESFISALSTASRTEARALRQRRETKYTVRFISIEAAMFEKEAKTPSDEELKRYYEDNQTEFEVPAKVAYDFVVIRPEDVEAEVLIDPSEVEFTYSENPARYSSKEQVKVRHIQLNFPKEADSKKMAAIRTKAEEVLQKARSGTPFEQLVMLYSDDIPSKTLAGDLGWIERGQKAPEFDEAVFKLKGEGIADLISTDYGFHIAKVEGYKPSTPLPLDSVRAEIEAELKRKEAPSYASVKAQELYESWTSGAASLTQLASDKKLTSASTRAAFADNEDPDAALSGLTAAVLEYPEGENRLLIELGRVAVLVEVKERKSVDYAPFPDVKPTIVEKLRKREAHRLAEEGAKQVNEDLTAGKLTDLDGIAKRFAVKIEEHTDLSIAKAQSEPFTNREVAEYLFSRTEVVRKPQRYFNVNGKFYFFDVSAVKLPELTTDTKDDQRFREEQSTINARWLESSIVNEQKSSSQIDVLPEILTAR